MFGGVWKVGHEITHSEVGVLSSVALFHSKSGILSGLRASLVLRAKALSLGSCSIISSAHNNGFHMRNVRPLSGCNCAISGQVLLGFP